MDERVREHAAVLVDWSARVEAGDDVVVSVAEDAHDLGVAVVEARGLDPRAPVDEHVGVFVYAFVHVPRVAGGR